MLPWGLNETQIYDKTYFIIRNFIKKHMSLNKKEFNRLDLGRFAKVCS